MRWLALALQQTKQSQLKTAPGRFALFQVASKARFATTYKLLKSNGLFRLGLVAATRSGR